MAKSLLLSTLYTYLGDFIEGLDQIENLKLGVFSGKIELSNLVLKASALDNLNLPITVTKGRLQNLKIKIPWTALGSKPVRVEIEGLYLQAGPVDISNLSTESLKKSAFDLKCKMLLDAENEVIESSIDQKSLQEQAAKASYLQLMIAKIIDNIEISISNVHIRYEDSISLPGKTFAAGVTISSIELFTTDDNWNQQFVDRSTVNDAMMKKLGKLENLGVYWNPVGVNFSNISNEEWYHTMHMMITGAKASDIHIADASPSSSSDYSPFRGSQNLSKAKEVKPLSKAASHFITLDKVKVRHILPAPNSITIKIIHSEKTTETIPKVDVSVNCTNLNLSIDKSQYDQILLTLDLFNTLEVNKQIALYRASHRPKQRPSSDPRGWWRYAYVLAVGREFNSGHTLQLMSKCWRVRGRYLYLVKKHRKSAESQKDGGAAKGSLSAAEEKELLHIDEELPTSSLIVFRKDAMVEMLAEIKKDKDSVHESTESFGAFATSFFSWAKSGISSSSSSGNRNSVGVKDRGPRNPFENFSSAPTPSKEAHIEEEDIDSLLTKLQLRGGAAASSESHSILKLHISFGASLTVLRFDTPVIFLQVSALTSGDVRAKFFSLEFSLNDIFIKDLCSKNPVIPYIIKAQDNVAVVSNLARQDTCKVVIENNAGKTAVKVYAQAIEIVWNEPCMQYFFSIFMPASGGAWAQAGKNSVNIDVMNQFAKEAAISMGEELLLFVEVNAPKIIIPDNYSVDSGCLLLDAGKVSMEGSLGAAGMSLSFSVTATNIGMPVSLAERYPARGVTQPYLIRPFDICMSLANIDRSDADMCLLLDVAPNITADLDPTKIRRLLVHVATCSRTFHPLQDKDGLEALEREHRMLVADAYLSRRDSSAVPMIKEEHSSATNKTASVETFPHLVKQNRAEIVRKTTILMNFKLPSVNLVLLLSGDHSITLSFDRLKTILDLSALDLRIHFSMSAISLLDSYRAERQGAIIWTPFAAESEKSPNLIDVCFTMCNSPKSTLFRDYAIDIEIIISTLSLSIDESAILRLYPFFEMLVSIQHDAAVLFAEKPSEKSAVDNKNYGNSTDKTKHNRPMAGVHFAMYLDSVSLDLMVERQGAALPMGVCKELDADFSASISGVCLDVALIDLLKIKVLLNSFQITDRREKSDNYIYKDLVCRSTIASETEQSASEKSDSNLVTVIFDQKDKSTTAIDVKVQDLTTFINVDSIMSFVDILMKTVNAVIKVTSVFNAPSLDAEINDTTKAKRLDRRGSRARSLSAHSIESLVAEEHLLVCVAVYVVNPRLLLIENPESSTSQAILGRCGIVIHYNRDLRDPKVQELSENVHLSLSAVEFLVIQDMSSKLQQQIVDQTHIEFHFIRSCLGEIMVNGKVALDISDLNVKVTLKDTLLVKAIVEQIQKTVDSKIDSSESRKVLEDKIVTNGCPSKAGPSEVKAIADNVQQNITMYNVTVHLGSIVVTAINDFNNDYRMLARVTMENLDCLLNGSFALGDVGGDISLFLSADYFNPTVADWEPIMERWNPNVSVSSGGVNGIAVEFAYQKTVQFNISGAMVKGLSHALKLVSQNFTSTEMLRESNESTVTFINELGVPVDLYDSKSGKKLFALPPRQPVSIDDMRKDANVLTSRERKSKHPTYYGLKFTGKLGQDRMPLDQLPLNASKPRGFQLIPSLRLLKDHKEDIMMEPILEEVYENERYDLRWTKPWFHMGDPAEWTDVTTKITRSDPKYHKLPSDKWVWVDPEWRVDMDGKIGDEIDASGWEYGVNFTAFTASNRRRTFKPLDSARRRRWIRARSLNNLSEDVARPLSVVWDVKTNKNGCRSVSIRSSTQICNELPFPVEFKLCGNISEKDNAPTIVVPSCGSHSVPLLFSHATFLVARPQETPHGWSNEISIRSLTSADSMIPEARDIVCDGGQDMDSLTFRASYATIDRTLVLTVAPYATVSNQLPCDLLFRCVVEGQRKEHGLIRPGATTKLVYTTFTAKTAQVQVQVGVYAWSALKDIMGGQRDAGGELRQVLEMHSHTDNDLISVTMISTISEMGTIEVSFFSTFALVDVSGLNLVVRTKKVDKKKTRNNEFDDATIVKYITRTSYRKDAEESVKANWVSGGNGLVLFHSTDKVAMLGVNMGECWSDELSLSSVGTNTKSPFEVVDNKINKSYQLAYSITSLPGIFKSTDQVKIYSAFVIVNCMDIDVMLQQSDSFHDKSCYTKVPPRTKAPWHKLDAKCGTTVHVRTAKSLWSAGAIDLNEIGDSVLLLPQSQTAIVAGDDVTVAHIEVKFADFEDDAYVVISIWREVSTDHCKNCSFSVRNLTSSSLVLQQLDSSEGDDDDELEALLFPRIIADLHRITYPPDSWEPFGWSCQYLGSSVQINASTGTTITSPLSQSTAVYLDFLKVGDSISMPVGYGVKLVLSVQATGYGVVLVAREVADEVGAWDGQAAVNSSASSRDESFMAQVSFSLCLKSVGLSIIAERHCRREFLSVYIENIDVKSRREIGGDSGTARLTVNLTVMDVQIDNYSETAVYPVMLHSFNSQERKDAVAKAKRDLALKRISAKKGGPKTANDSHREGSGAEPQDLSALANFITMSVWRDTPRGSANSIYKYVALKVLEVKVALDSSTLQIYLLDLHPDLMTLLETREQALAMEFPEQWMERHNAALALGAGSAGAVDIDKILNAACSEKLYVENLVLHPLKINITFTPTRFPRSSSEDIFSSRKYKVFKWVKEMASIDELVVKVSSFIITSNMMEPFDQLKLRIASAFLRDLKKELFLVVGRVIGNLSVLGRPAGLYRKVGGGIKTFFYEPYQGMIHSPEGLARGLKVGSQELAKSLGSGIISSGASIVGSASKVLAKGAAMAVRDETFKKNREAVWQQAASSSGVKSGMKVSLTLA